MLMMSELTLRWLLGDLVKDRSIMLVYDDLWTQMRVQGDLDSNWDPDPKIMRVTDGTDIMLVDADELAQLLSWWAKNGVAPDRPRLAPIK